MQFKIRHSGVILVVRSTQLNNSLLAHSIRMSLCNRKASVVRLSVRPSVNFYTKIATSTTNMTGSPPNLQTYVVPTWAYIQSMLKVKVKVKGHVIRTLL